MRLWMDDVQNVFKMRRVLLAATLLLCFLGATASSYRPRGGSRGSLAHRYRGPYLPARRSGLEASQGYYPEKYYEDYGKHDFEFLLPLLLLLLAPLAVTAFLLPITASLMTNTLFLVNGVAPGAAIQGRRRRDVSGGLSQELLDVLERLDRAVSKYGSPVGS